ncbi:hypothetical protein EDEG_02130 [Edhazardia aedis USNM 41457]|uniref:Uncharacterized protein n=1 Tax=Edhazardia aedis (strain USNM 41457) TaxID=1003232 RepID=J9D712_EDHAE|nr:hypothetical protein EDEG_02130 [Edhazardia aedis USNM 41457]|eukprot:EJW03546.1 hypothetical protein EDEG_02130 [Edhazardia aedis USNM 41457]
MDAENKFIEIEIYSKALSYLEYLYNYMCLYIVNDKSIEHTNLQNFFYKLKNTFYTFLSQYNTNDPHIPNFITMVELDFNNLINSFHIHISTLDDDKQKQKINYALKSCAKQLETYFSRITKNSQTSKIHQNRYFNFLDKTNSIDENDVIDFSIRNEFKYTWKTLKNYRFHLESWSNLNNKKNHEIFNEIRTSIYKLAKVCNVVVEYVYIHKKLCGDKTNLELRNIEEMLFSEIFGFYSFTHKFLSFHVIYGDILEDQILEIKLSKIGDSLILIIRILKIYLSKLINIKYKEEQEDIINVLEALKSPLLTYLRILCCARISEN